MGPEDYLRDGVLRRLLQAVTTELPKKSDAFVAEIVAHLRKSKAKILKQLRPTEAEAAAVEDGFADTATRAQQVLLLKLWVRTLVPPKFYPTVGSFLPNYKQCVLRLLDPQFADAFPTVKNGQMLTLLILEWHNVNVGIVPAKPKFAAFDDSALQKIAQKHVQGKAAERPARKKRPRPTPAPAGAPAAGAPQKPAAEPATPATPATPETPATPFVTEMPNSAVAEAVDWVLVEEPSSPPLSFEPPAEVSLDTAASDAGAEAGGKRAAGDGGVSLGEAELIAMMKRVRTHLVDASGVATLRELAEALSMEEDALIPPMHTMHEEDVLFFDADTRTVYAL